jgi:hypothetical protein
VALPESRLCCGFHVFRELFQSFLVDNDGLDGLFGHGSCSLVKVVEDAFRRPVGRLLAMRLAKLSRLS